MRNWKKEAEEIACDRDDCRATPVDIFILDMLEEIERLHSLCDQCPDVFPPSVKDTDDEK